MGEHKCPRISLALSDKEPAVMFAVNRTASVPGRIRLLIVSIIIISY